MSSLWSSWLSPSTMKHYESRLLDGWAFHISYSIKEPSTDSLIQSWQVFREISQHGENRLNSNLTNDWCNKRQKRKIFFKKTKFFLEQQTNHPPALAKQRINYPNKRMQTENCRDKASEWMSSSRGQRDRNTQTDPGSGKDDASGWGRKGRWVANQVPTVPDK